MRLQRVLGASCLFTIGVFVVGVFAIRDCNARWMDLSNKSPDELFRRVFRKPVPMGVTDVRAAGESHLSGSIWMRFSMQDVDGTLKKLGVVGSPNSRKDWADWRFPKLDIRYNGADRLHWEEVPKDAATEFYDIPQENSGAGWSGSIVIDRAKKRAFLYGTLM